MRYAHLACSDLDGSIDGAAWVYWLKDLRIAVVDSWLLPQGVLVWRYA